MDNMELECEKGNVHDTNAATFCGCDASHRLRQTGVESYYSNIIDIPGVSISSPSYFFESNSLRSLILLSSRLYACRSTVTVILNIPLNPQIPIILLNTIH